MLTPQQKESIKVVSGDGARWITDCVREYLLNCERCVTSFHVVECAMSALDEVRIEYLQGTTVEVDELLKQVKPSLGRLKSKNGQTIKEYVAAKVSMQNK